MGLFFKTHRKHAIAGPHRKASRAAPSRLHVCRIEQMESRQLLSVSAAPVQIGAVYFEDSHPHDEVGDVVEITFKGGAPGTQLTQLQIDTDKLGDGLGMGDTFFDTATGGLGVYGSSPFAIVSQSGINSVTAEVTDGGMTLLLHFQGFDAGEKFVFSIDVDEQGFEGPNAVAEGGEFAGSLLTAVFDAPHYAQAIGSDLFRDAYDAKLTAAGLDLPVDDYSPPSPYMPPGSEPGPVYTAGAIFPLQQTPLPITLSGTVFEDFDTDNVRQFYELGISGVQLTLYELIGETYVDTGKTATTDAAGNYKFEGLLPSTYRVVETQPDGYLSVGAIPGAVNGATRGFVTTVDILSGINLDGGEDSVQNDFGEVWPAELSGYVYHDANNNGVFDDGETPIAGAQVALLNGAGSPTGRTAATDASGFYRFDNLMPGTYGVAETQPAGYFDGLDAPGTAGGDAHNPGDLIDGVQLFGGQWGLHYDFGELKPASVSGYVYVDANNNGVFDDGETPIAGAQVALLDGAGNPTGRTAATDDAGFYRFDNLMVGAYAVAETQPAGYFDGLDAPGTVGGAAHNPGDLIDGFQLASGQSGLHYDFGELKPVCVSGHVYVDANNNGLFEEGETPIAGAVVALLDANGNPTGETRTTDGNGFYRFCGMAPGTYGLRETQPAGYDDGRDVPGTAGGFANNPGDQIDSIPLDSGVKATDYDFGELPPPLPAKISGHVFQDGPAIVVQQGAAVPDIPSVRDGQITPDDTMLAGITVVLCDGSGIPWLDADGNEIVAVTDAYGYYEFNDLEPGLYSVKELRPDGYQPGVSTVGTKGGTLFNRYERPDPSMIVALGLVVGTGGIDETGIQSATITTIYVDAGDVAENYDFSEVLLKYDSPKPPPYVPTPPAMPPMASVGGGTAGGSPFAGTTYMVPQIVMRPMSGGSGGPGGYSWHLSIIDAGQPRRDGSGDQFTQYPQNTLFDPVSWTGADVNQSQWILADQNGATLQVLHFGMPGATPVAGDWDGSGATKVGVFIDGLWFLDLNGNGRWDEADLWAKLGKKGDQPVSGDWNGDGKIDIGIFGPAWIGDLKAISAEPGLPDAQNPPGKNRPKNVPPDPTEATVGWRTLKKGNAGRMRSDLIDHVFQYGTKGDRAVTGDWNGDGIYTSGIVPNGHPERSEGSGNARDSSLRSE